MGCDTEGFIYSDSIEKFSKEALVEYLSKRYTDVVIHADNNDWSYMIVTFKDGEDYRNLSVHYNYTSFKHEGFPEISDDAIILFSLGMWKNSVAIIKGIVNYFGGGYIIENDCTDDWIMTASDKSTIPEIQLQYKLMAEYHISEKEATEWINIYEKVGGLYDKRKG